MDFAPLKPSQKRAEHLEQWRICERYKQVLCYVEKFRGKKAIQHFLNSGLDKPVFFHVIALIVFAFLLTRWTYIRFRRLILD